MQIIGNYHLLILVIISTALWTIWVTNPLQEWAWKRLRRRSGCQVEGEICVWERRRTKTEEERERGIEAFRARKWAPHRWKGREMLFMFDKGLSYIMSLFWVSIGVSSMKFIKYLPIYWFCVLPLRVGYTAWVAPNMQQMSQALSTHRLLWCSQHLGWNASAGCQKQICTTVTIV